jgi:uncharacterized coiled-coil DUF342 family protein
MKDSDKEKIIKKYEQKKKELKNTVLKMEVLKYIKRNSVNLSNEKINKMDNDIINNKIKTRLSHQFQFAKFEDDLDELEKRIKNILPKIEYLKNTEKDEVDLDKYIDKQNTISTEFKKLLEEKITIENGQEIDKKKIALLKEYEPLYKKMCEYFKKHDEKMKLFNEINKEGAQLLKEVEGQVDIYNTKKLNLKKEVNNLLDKFMNFMEEIKNLKLVKINEKCNKEVKKAMDFFTDVKQMQNKLNTFVDEYKDNIKQKQNEILPQEKYDKIYKRENELMDVLIKLKESIKDYEHLLKLIEEENTIMKNCEIIVNNITKENPKDLLTKLENYEKQIEELANKINKFQGDIKIIIELFNGYVKDTNEVRKEISEVFDKFKENKVPNNENFKNLVDKINELDAGFKELKVKEMLEKNKSELLANWDKVNEAYNNTFNKFNESQGKKERIMVYKTTKNNADSAKMKEIKDKVNKEMTVLEKEQNGIKNTLDKIKNDKKKLIEDINTIIKEEEKLLNDIKGVFKNDIKNITKQNIKENFEKYKTFNEKSGEIGPKINQISPRCKSLFESYNSFIKLETENRKKIYDTAKILQENGIGIDEKIKNILNKVKEIFDEIESLDLNEINGLFNNNLVGKFKEMQNIISTVSQLLSSK